MIIEQPALHAYSEASGDCVLACLWEQGRVRGGGRDAGAGDAVRVGDAGENP